MPDDDQNQDADELVDDAVEKDQFALYQLGCDDGSGESLDSAQERDLAMEKADEALGEEG